MYDFRYCKSVWDVVCRIVVLNSVRVTEGLNVELRPHQGEEGVTEI